MLYEAVVDNCCAPILEVEHLHRRQRRVLVAVLAINVATLIWMVAAAYVTRSSAILSGGLDNLGDALTYALSLAVVGSTAAAIARVAQVKGILILLAAASVAAQIVWRLVNPTVPVFGGMTVAASVNLVANGVCLALLTPHRHDNVNMSSVWECSRNDIMDGVAVLVAAGGVYLFQAGWPDILVAILLMVLFVRSGLRVLRDARASCDRPAR